jgi:hypothetical protein
MIARLARWWLLRKGLAVELAPEDDPLEPEYWNPVGECICGLQVAGDDWHIVVAFSDDDDSLGMAGDGGTAMSADFCAQHCPGGCRRGCPILTP